MRKFILPHLPADSHAHMNLDDPDDKGLFDYVLQASIKRTRIEFEKTIAQLSSSIYASFSPTTEN